MMKKHLNEINNLLGTDNAANLVSELLMEVDLYREESHDKELNASGSKELRVPSFVEKNELSFALYTDGACRGNPGPGSYAFLVQNNRHEMIFENADYSEHTTNNKMEMSAVIQGLVYLADQITPMHTIYIFTDSKYVVDGMKSWIHGWKKRGWKKADKKAPENLELWKQLDELSGICNIEFHWVKGHSGHPQNEYVDGLANKVLDENGF